MATLTPATATDTGLVLDSELPAFDVVITESVVVAADADTTYRAVRSLDFLQVRTPVLRVAFRVRGLPDRLRRRPALPPARLVLAEGDPLPGWLVLGERLGQELAFGAVGTFWTSSIAWRDVPRADFASFSEPGFGKIACDLRVRPCGEAASLVTYECRTATTSPDARRALRRYWWLIRPFVGHIMRATVNTIRDNAEAKGRER